MKPAYIVIFITFIFTVSCKGKTHPVSEVERDTTITKSNSFSDLFLDSAEVEGFITLEHPDEESAKRLRNFYNSRSYQFAWFTKEGMAEHTRAFWNLQESHIVLSKDSSLFNRQLSAEVEMLMSEDTTSRHSANEIASTELALTLQFFKYVQYAYAGRVNPEELSWHIPRKKVDEMVLLDSLIANKGQHLETWEPVNPQYLLMKSKLKEIYDQEKAGSLDLISSPRENTWKPGDSSLTITQVKKKLIALKDYPSTDSSRSYNMEFNAAIKRAQKRFGFNQDGIIDDALIKALNVPIHDRIKQMLINMERMRWFPRQASGDYIMANIPEFKLHLFRDSEKVFDIDIIVGKAANRTIIFNGMLKYVVFSPYWNVPPSIVQNEILPAIRKKPGYLRSQNMEQTGFSDGLPEFRQRPGGDNALGKVKFIFPNNYNIYFHDTPAKSLFKQEKRTFSHGCIRLAEPRKLADYLLRNQVEWTPEKITHAMNASKETWVILEDPVPVAVTYFTAWVSRDGLLNFREDIYGHDERMAVHLFPAAHKSE
jgi:L,D-transpeptidase YcbB